MAHKITPFLWFDGKAEEAANFYVSVFKNSKILNVSRYGDDGVGAPGAVMTVKFELEGQAFIALNGGPQFAFTPAISFFVDCENQEQVDELWDKLSAGGKDLQCGWVTDKFGLTWQIIPSILIDMLQDDDDEKSSRVMKAMLGMVKIDIAGLKKAYDQE